MTEFDDTLRRLFAEARENPPADDFLQKAAVRISHARRRRAIARVAVTTAAVGLVVAATPYVTAGSLTVASHLGAWLPAFGNSLTSPAAWIGYLAVAGWSIRRVARLI